MSAFKRIFIFACMLLLAVSFAKTKKNKKKSKTPPAELVTTYTPPEEIPAEEVADEETSKNSDKEIAEEIPAEEATDKSEAISENNAAEENPAEEVADEKVPLPEEEASKDSDKEIAEEIPAEETSDKSEAISENNAAEENPAEEVAEKKVPLPEEEASKDSDKEIAEEIPAEEATDKSEAISENNAAEENSAEEDFLEETVPLPSGSTEYSERAIKKRRDPNKRIYLFEGYEAFDTYTSIEDRPKLIENPDKKDKNGRTLLQIAAANDNLDSIESLFMSGASIDLTDSDLWTPLMYAARFAKKRATVEALINRGANVKAKNRYGRTALDIAASHSKSAEVVDALAKHYSKNELGVAFITAVSTGRDVKIIEKFIEYGISPNSIYKGKTALMYAAETNTNTNCIKFLLESGADKTLVTADRKDAYYFASKNPNLPRNSVYWSLNNSGNK